MSVVGVEACRGGGEFVVEGGVGLVLPVFGESEALLQCVQGGD